MHRQYYVGACAGSYVEWVIPPEYRATWVRQAPGRRLIREASEIEADGCARAGDKPIAKDKAMLARERASEAPPVEKSEAPPKIAPKIEGLKARPWKR